MTKLWYLVEVFTMPTRDPPASWRPVSANESATNEAKASTVFKTRPDYIVLRALTYSFIQ